MEEPVNQGKSKGSSNNNNAGSALGIEARNDLGQKPCETKQDDDGSSSELKTKKVTSLSSSSNEVTGSEHLANASPLQQDEKTHSDKDKQHPEAAMKKSVHESSSSHSSVVTGMTPIPTEKIPVAGEKSNTSVSDPTPSFHVPSERQESPEQAENTTIQETQSEISSHTGGFCDRGTNRGTPQLKSEKSRMKNIDESENDDKTESEKPKDEEHEQPREAAMQKNILDSSGSFSSEATGMTQKPEENIPVAGEEPDTSVSDLTPFLHKTSERPESPEHTGKATIQETQSENEAKNTVSEDPKDENHDQDSGAAMQKNILESSSCFSTVATGKTPTEEIAFASEEPNTQVSDPTPFLHITSEHQESREQAGKTTIPETLSAFEMRPSSDLRPDAPRNDPKNTSIVWIIGACGILLSVVCAAYFENYSSQPPNITIDLVSQFNLEMDKIKGSFPSQHPELWRRSLIHLRRHLKTSRPTEPVSLILTSGPAAEKTLGCLAQCLAQGYSTPQNGSVLNVDGQSKRSQDSDQVKMDIDDALKSAFESRTFAAIIHRFEELPPGSTLIFYRYCDHENAAYQKVLLVFTVMLDEEIPLTSSLNLGPVEEMVQEHLRQKFVSSSKAARFNQMDADKFSGLWSRISHVVLPITAEEKIEIRGCEICGKFF